MAALDNTKFFWMRLYTRFFDKHEIQILWGKNRDYVLLYLRLLLESVPNHGLLRYNKNLSYSIEDIALLFHMPEEVVAAGIKELINKELIIIDEDGTMYLPAAPAMTDGETGGAARMRDRRNGTNDLNTLIDSSVNIQERNKSKQVRQGTNVPPKNFNALLEVLINNGVSVSNHSALAAKFLSLTENNWTSENGKPIRDWFKYIKSYCNIQLADETIS